MHKVPVSLRLRDRKSDEQDVLARKNLSYVVAITRKITMPFLAIFKSHRIIPRPKRIHEDFVKNSENSRLFKTSMTEYLPNGLLREAHFVAVRRIPDATEPPKNPFRDLLVGHRLNACGINRSQSPD